jgi:hypothetical protein
MREKSTSDSPVSASCYRQHAFACAKKAHAAAATDGLTMGHMIIWLVIVVGVASTVLYYYDSIIGLSRFSHF